MWAQGSSIKLLETSNLATDISVSETWNMKKSSGIRKAEWLIVNSTKLLLHHLKNSHQRSWLWPAGLQSRWCIAKRCWGFLLQDVGLLPLRSKEVSCCRTFFLESAYQKSFQSSTLHSKPEKPETWESASLKQGFSGFLTVPGILVWPS